MRREAGVAGGVSSRSWADRVFGLALGVVAVSVLGFVLAWVFQWPSDFVVGAEPDSEVTLTDFVNGTVTSIPLPPLLVLIVAAPLSRSRRWWGALATGVVAMLGVLFLIGGVGELTSDNPHVPRAVLLIAGVLYVLAGLALVCSGALALRSRVRAGPR